MAPEKQIPKKKTSQKKEKINKTYQVIFRITEKQKQLLEEMSAPLGMKMGDFVRNLTIEKIKNYLEERKI
jgi:uncharacterized protein (DUF1778 family)